MYEFTDINTSFLPILIMTYYYFDGYDQNDKEIYCRHFIDDTVYEHYKRIKLYKSNIIYNPKIYLDIIKLYLESTDIKDLILSYIYEVNETELDKVTEEHPYINYISKYLLLYKNYKGIMDNITFDIRGNINIIY